MDLETFLRETGIHYSTDHRKHGRQGWVQIQNCPRCGSRNYHLGIKLDLSRAACYKCGGFRVFNVLRQLVPHATDVISDLCRQGIFRLRETLPDSRYSARKLVYPDGLCKMDERHRAFLVARNLDPDYLEAEWKCQGIGSFAKYPMRLFIPIAYNQVDISWTARAVCGQEPRYQTCPDENKLMNEKHSLFGIDFVQDTAIIVEGPLDAIRGGKGFVATYGTAITNAQVAAMAGITRRIICLDNEPIAQSVAARIARDLSMFPGETIVTKTKAKDIGESSDREIQELRNFAFGN